MKNSKYSNYAGSKCSGAFTQDLCEQHEGLPYTNFCSAITCIRPLCPQCVQNHSMYHRNMRTQSQIHSFKTLKNQCINKITNILKKINYSSNQQCMKQIHGIFLQFLDKLTQMKNFMNKILQSYFINLQDVIKKKMDTILSQQSDIFQQINKANNIINQLKILLHLLNNSKDFLQSSKTIVSLDVDKIEDKIKNCYNTVNALKQHCKINFHGDLGYQQKFINFLSKLAYYGQYGTNQVLPRVTEQIMVDNNMDDYLKNFKQQRKPRNYLSDYQLKYKQQQNREGRISNNQLKSSALSGSTRPYKTIININTFKQQSTHKYLHFFQNDKNILHYLDLENTQPQFSIINLNITFNLPQFHKSIALPNGDLYLIGGSLPNNLKSQKIYKYDFNKNTLIHCNSLKYGRSSHSICFNNKYIYILGGILNNQIITNRCERFDVINNKIEEIKPMNYEACSFACCSFNDRYIYKIGGIAEDNSISSAIQVFDQRQNDWKVLKIVGNGQGEQVIPVASSAAIQISQNQIMVMGGYNQSNVGEKQTYIIRTDIAGTYSCDINTFPLPFAQGFWNNIPVLQNKLVFVLQNVSEGKDDCLEDYRKILVFDGQRWKCINN